MTGAGRGSGLGAALDEAVAGAGGALMGLYLYAGRVRSDSLWRRDALAGALIGGSIGFVVNAAGPARDGAWLRAARSATWGTIAGALGGAAGLIVGEFALGGLKGGLLGRAVSWSILGLGIGASQGLAHRSAGRLRFGLIGGGLGGFVGGSAFEALRDRLAGRYAPGQGLGMVVLGAGLGLCIALVERALRRAWVVVLSGRQEGRSYLLADRSSILGLDEHAAVGLFGDAEIGRRHAEIAAAPAGFVLRNHDPRGRTRLNGRPAVGDEPLRDGDRIELGRTHLLFRSR